MVTCLFPYVLTVEEALMESTQGSGEGPNPSLILTTFTWSLELWHPGILHLPLDLGTLEIPTQGPESRTMIIWKGSHFRKPM